VAEELLINIIGDASKLKGELAKASKNVTSFSDKVVKVGKIATAAGVAVTAAFTAIVLKTAAVGDQFDKMSLRTGIAVEDLSALAYAADISGSDIGTLEKGLKALTKVMDDASRGIGEGLDAFRELDIAVVDVEGNLRSTVDVLKEAATKISAVEDPTKQLAYAMDLFGARAGPQLLPLLKMGEKGIDGLMKKAEELGIVISTEAATAAAEFTDRLTDLKGSLAGAGRTIGDTLIPILIPLIEKVVEIVGRVKEWVEENKPLVENIVKWAAGLGLALAVIGPMLMLLPALITGVTMLSGAFLPFLIGGAIIAGLVKVNDLLEDMYWNAYRAEMALDTISVAELDREIDSLAKRIKEMNQHINVLKENPLNLVFDGWQGSVEQLEAVVRELEAKMGVLIQKRYELTGAVEEGIEVDEEKVEVDKLIAEGQEIVNKLLDDWNEKIKLYTKYTGEANEINADLLDGMYRWTQVGAQWKQLALYFLGFRDSLKAVEKATDEVTVAEETMAKATGKVYNKWYELAKLWLVRPDLRAYFEEIGRSLDDLNDTVEEKTNNFMEIFEDLKDDFKSDFVDPIVGYLESNLANAIEALLTGSRDFEWSWKNFWEGLKDILIKAVAAMIAKLVVLAGFKWLIKIVFPWLPFEEGGGVGFDKGGPVKGFQAGGVTDTIPARLTVGEYVIAKPMTDFIREFRAIPSNLVDAIVRGLPTPTPAFAGGGLVGSSNVSAVGFGGATIYIDIHDNRISDDVDVRKLATKVSDEILRKLNLTRRH